MAKTISFYCKDRYSRKRHYDLSARMKGISIKVLIKTSVDKVAAVMSSDALARVSSSPGLPQR